MPSFFVSIALLMLLFVSGCGYKNEADLLQRLNARLPQHGNNKKTDKPIPRYGYSEDIPIYEEHMNNNYTGGIYPTYDSEADNPVYQEEESVPNQYSYPTYDAEADNPYYPEGANGAFIDRVYPEVYPTYEQEADNPYYPEYPYYEQQKTQQQYQYQYYSPEADNPILPSESGNGLFDSPSFDTPLFAD